MPTLSFLFQSWADDQARCASINEINSWAEVEAADFLKHEAKNPEVRRMAWARVADESKLMEVLARLQKLPAVKSAQRPAPRKLL